MALTKMKNDKVQRMFIDGIIETLMKFRVYNDGIVIHGEEYSYQDVLNRLKKIGMAPSNKLNDYIAIRFGESGDEENDLEYKLAKILALYILISRLPGLVNCSQHSRRDLKVLLKNTRNTLQRHMPDYSIVFDGDGIFKEYKPVEEESVTENLSEIPKDIADPIKELLKPMKNEDELIGLMSKVYSEFENIKKDHLPNLNDVDKGIYKRARELAMMVVNNVNQAKGHKGKSFLTIKDIAHNFALNASLVQKLININEKKAKYKD